MPSELTIENSLDVILALLYAPSKTKEFGEAVLGTTRLQKLVFLLWKEGKFSSHIPNLYGFQPYDFGPCMNDIYDDIDFAVEIDLIKKTESATSNSFDDADNISFLSELGFEFKNTYTRIDYSLSKTGMEAGKELFDSLGEQDRSNLVHIKAKYNKMPLYNLLRYVYEKYPKFAEKSKLIL